MTGLISKFKEVKILDDEKIARELVNHNEDVIGYVIRKYSKLLYSVVNGVLGSLGTTQDIEECVADTFIYLWENPDKFDPKKGKLKTWLSIIARTQAYNRCRVFTKQCTLPLEDAVLVNQMDIADEAADEETMRTLIAAIKALKEPDREILIRRYYYEQKPSEIAFVLCMNVKQVENCLFRTKAKLRKAICNKIV